MSNSAVRAEIDRLAKEQKPVLIALSGDTGSGKDTLARLLQPFGYKRFAFGDELRELVKAVYGEPASQDERGDCYTSKQIYGDDSDETNLSFKDAMVELGGQLALASPLCLSRNLFAKLSQHKGNAVVTDMRKPVEMLELSKLADVYDLYFVYVNRAYNEYEQKPLDGLLEQCRISKAKADGNSPCLLPQFNGEVSNYDQPELMLLSLRRVLERTVPFRKASLN